MVCLNRCANLWCFLTVFCLCYFLETITFTYLITAVTSVERHFQIPSRQSGTLIAASDIGYVLTVVVLAYMGSKGNRARWIGGGCLLISLACFLGSSPAFIFSTKEQLYDHNFIVNVLTPPAVKSVLIAPSLDMVDPDDAVVLDRARQAFERAQRADDIVAPPPIHEEETFIGGNKATESNLLPQFKGPIEKVFARNSGASADSDKVNDDNDAEILLTPVDALNLTEHETSLLKNAATLPFTVCDRNVQKVWTAIRTSRCLSTGATTNTAGYAIVFTAIALIGVGHSMPWTLGMPLIDDNVSKKNTPFFFAGVFFIRIMGPVLGFLIGGYANKLYVTLKPPRGLSPSDPGWIGAWWLGFLIVSLALFVPSILLLCFPDINLNMKTKRSKYDRRRSSSLKNPEVNSRTQKIDGRIRLADEKTAGQQLLAAGDNKGGKILSEKSDALPLDNDKDSETWTKKLTEELKAFGYSLGECLKSPIYVGCLIGRMFDAFAFKGSFAFQPKYLEYHYGIPQYKVNFYMALMGVVGFAFGVLIGSLAMRKLRLEGRRAALYVGVSSMLSVMLSFSQIFLGCDSVNSQIARQGVRTNFDFNQQCNTDCHCATQNLYPTCGENGIPYFSPCYAGCTKIQTTAAGLFSFNISDCSCANGGSVSKLYCKDDCVGPMTWYIMLSIISGVINGSGVIPGILILFRSLTAELRSVGLGFSAFLVSLLSTFPSPIVFGYIIDTTCLLWETSCGSRGACQLYDSRLLRVRIHMCTGVLRSVALLFDIWVFYFAKGMKLMEEESTSSGQHEKIEAAAIGDQLEPGSPPTVKDRESKRLSLLSNRSRRKSVALDMVEDFGSLYELQCKSEGADEPENLVKKFSV